MLDFKAINFGIWIAKKGDREFIVQDVQRGDAKRHAQTSPAAMIDGDWHDCKTVDEAFALCNAAI